MTEEDLLEQLRADILILKDRIHEVEKFAAVTNEKLDNINQSVSKINGTIEKGLWMFGGSILLAAAGWVINGGLASVQ